MKSYLARFLGILYLGLTLICVTLILKSGASIFYSKLPVDATVVTPVEGHAFQYTLTFNPSVYRPEDLLILEDTTPLTRQAYRGIVASTYGSFLVGRSVDNKVEIYFSTSDGSSPSANGRRYTLYLHLKYISRGLGAAGLLILLPGLIWFLSFALLIPTQRKMIARSPLGIVQVWDQFAGHLAQLTDSLTVGTPSWRRLFSVTVLAAYFYVFMEWIFFVTKPSFMSIMGFPEKARILFISGLLLSLLAMGVIGLNLLLELICGMLRRPRLARLLIAFIPAFILAVLALLMIDNFTYTVFKFGISTSSGPWRGAYELLFLLLLALIHRQLLKQLFLRHNGHSSGVGWPLYLTIGLLVISGSISFSQLISRRTSGSVLSAQTHQIVKLPNIILLGSDGVNAPNLSVYGYGRDTTPTLRELAPSLLIAENAFPNAPTTSGSLVSIFTSKLPTQTRVLYPPNILTGLDTYQHLPGLLKQLGYETQEWGSPNYADSYKLNLQGGFNRVNGRRQSEFQSSPFLNALGYQDEAYYLSELFQRASDRLLHIFYIRVMDNPFSIVNRAAEWISDDEKLSDLINVIEDSDAPVFFHVHLMNTHGPIFEPSLHVFGQGEQKDDWSIDFYDDAILSFDHSIGELIDRLKADGEYDNTILIIYSDHAAMPYSATQRVPLIFHFPGDAYAQKIDQNVQNIDIAPTILDYLGMAKPDWMTGVSLLNGDLDRKRLSFSGATSRDGLGESGIFVLDAAQIKPPFFQFSSIDVVNCQKWYHMNLDTQKWISGEVGGYIHPCPQEDLLSPEAIRRAMIDRLTQDGFDTSSLTR